MLAACHFPVSTHIHGWSMCWSHSDWELCSTPHPYTLSSHSNVVLWSLGPYLGCKLLHAPGTLHRLQTPGLHTYKFPDHRSTPPMCTHLPYKWWADHWVTSSSCLHYAGSDWKRTLQHSTPEKCTCDSDTAEVSSAEGLSGAEILQRSSAESRFRQHTCHHDRSLSSIPPQYM